MNLVWILLTFAMPVIFSVMGVIIILGSGDKIKDRVNSAFRLNSENGLVKQGLLWMAIMLPLLFGISIGFWVWSEYSISLNAAGYAEFIKISVLPLAIMSISLPLAGLVSRFHSTHQAAKQISITMHKNNLDAFAAHRKGMFEYFSSLEETKYFNEYGFAYKVHPVLHKRFFTGSPEKGWPSRNEAAFDQVQGYLKLAAMYLIRVLDGTPENRVDNYLNSSINIYWAANEFHIRQITREMVKRGVYVKGKNDDGGASTLGVNTLETLAALRFVREYYNNLCDFSGRDRMELNNELESVFEKTQHWIEQGYFIEEIHAHELELMVAKGDAIYGEKHSRSLQA